MKITVNRKEYPKHLRSYVGGQNVLHKFNSLKICFCWVKFGFELGAQQLRVRQDKAYIQCAWLDVLLRQARTGKDNPQ